MSDANFKKKPTSDDLAGTPLCSEETSAPKSRPVRVRGGPVRGSSTAPTPDDLAGIPVTVEGEEDLTVRPMKAPRNR